LHGTCKAKKVRGLLVELLSGLRQVVEGTYRVIAEKRYRERIKDAFGVDPLLCKKCGTEMELEQIYHPKYGVIYDGWRRDLVRDEYEPGTGDAVLGPVGEVSLQMQFVWA
jgi:hypothetical protein